MISIALCTYNGEQYLAELLQSIAQQSLLPDEIIIQDDNSSDATATIVTDFIAQTDITVSFEVNSSRLGVTQNFSKALSRCRGDYILFADQDDVWYPEKIATLQQKMGQRADTTPTLVYSDADIIDDQSKVSSQTFVATEGLQPASEADYLSLTVINRIPGCTMLINRALAEAVNPIPEQAVLHDWWTASIASLVGQIIYVDQPLLGYRIHGDNEWGLDSDNRTQKLSRLGVHGGLTQCGAHFQRAVVQAHAIKTSVGQASLPNDWLTMINALAGKGLVKLKPFLLGKINRQGAMRWFSFIIGAIMVLQKTLDTKTHD